MVDINFQSATVLSTAMPAEYFLPPFNRELRDWYLSKMDRDHALFRWLDRDIRRRFGIAAPMAERPIDLFFAGYKTPERTNFFVRSASYLAQKECFLAYSDTPPSTRKLDSSTASLFPNYLGLAAQTKIVLTLHRYPVGYFEWEASLFRRSCAAPACTTPRCCGWRPTSTSTGDRRAGHASPLAHLALGSRLARRCLAGLHGFRGQPAATAEIIRMDERYTTKTGGTHPLRALAPVRSRRRVDGRKARSRRGQRQRIRVGLSGCGRRLGFRHRARSIDR